MDSIIAPIAVTALLVLLAFFVWVSRRRQRTPGVSVRPRPVLQGACKRLDEALRAGLPNHRVLARVPFSAFLEPRTQGERPPLPLEAQIADFLVCDSNFRVVAVVELADGPRRTEREMLLRDAALPLVRWKPDTLPDASEVRETIRDLESLRAMSDEFDSATTPEDGDTPGRTATDHSPGDRREPHL